jgi:MFS family permease
MPDDPNDAPAPAERARPQSTDTGTGTGTGTAPASPEGSPARSSGQDFDRRLTPPLVLGTLLNPINSSMIAVTLVPIGTAFGAAPATTLWLVSALYLATAVGQPAVGRLVDRHGSRPVYLLGTALVGLAGLLGTLAPSIGVLILARVLLGLGTCAAYPAAMSLIRSEAARTGRSTPGGILTALSVAAQASSAIGPTLGGLLVGADGWRTVFAVNIPLSLACLVLGHLRLPRTPAGGTARADRPRTGLDALGMALFTGTVTAALLFLMGPSAAHWYLPVLAAVLAAALATHELRAEDPFIDLRMLGTNRPLLLTYLRQILYSTVTYSMLYGFTQWLEQGRGLSESGAGLIMLPLSLSAIGVATLTGRRREIRGKLVVGSGVAAVAAALLLLLRPGSPIWLLVVVAVLSGLPQGLNGLANQNALYRQAPAERLGTASGLLRTFQYGGAMVASAAIAGVFPHQATAHGLHLLALAMLACTGLLLAITLLDPSLRRTTQRADA